MNRQPFDQTAMEIAKIWAQRSTCSSRVQVGAVLVNKSHRIVAAGYNGAPRGFPHCDDDGCILDAGGHCTVAIHAEENAVLQCAMDGVSTVGLTLYCTHSPCVHCAYRICQAGITEVVFGEFYGSATSIFRVNSILEHAAVHYRQLDQSKSEHL